jgi:imidazolonepropionase
MVKIFTNIGNLIQARNQTPGILKGVEMKLLPCLKDAFLKTEEGKVVEFGSMSNCPQISAEYIDMGGDWVFPGWCDSHTHIVYAKSREDEFVARVKGQSYEEIAANGGGILNSARRLQETPEEALLESAWKRLMEVTSFGTTAIEIKSGYGLSFESEIKMLRVIRSLKSMWPGVIKATFLGAHAIPTEYRADRAAYIRLITDKMIPFVAEEALADYCDVFCDRGFFTPEETDIILEAGWKYGLKPKIHANELGITGGVQAGVRNNALSVDHLECMGIEEVEVLRDSGTMPVLLPQTAFFLGIPYAPARLILDEGLPLAVASDYNPGSTPSGNMPFVVSLSCIKMKMLPEEAINAATINGAYALELGSTHGSFAPGSEASFFTTEPMSSLAFLPYAFGSAHILKVFIKGNRII